MGLLYQEVDDHELLIFRHMYKFTVPMNCKDPNRNSETLQKTNVQFNPNSLSRLHMPSLFCISLVN